MVSDALLNEDKSQLTHKNVFTEPGEKESRSVYDIHWAA